MLAGLSLLLPLWIKAAPASSASATPSSTSASLPSRAGSAPGVVTGRASASEGAVGRQWMPLPPPGPRLGAADIGVVINDADPYSRAVGAYYVRQRRVPASQVLHLTLPLAARLTQSDFANLQQAIDAHFGARTRALALAWTLPFAVECQSITGALALGFDVELCSRSCAPPSRVSPYYGSGTAATLRSQGMRLAMQLAAPSVLAAQRLIDRGVASDGRMGLRGAPPVTALFAVTSDRARNVRAARYPPADYLRRWGVEVRVEASDDLRDRERLLLLETGLAQVPHLDTLHWIDGALADHLTSFGGVLDGTSGQTTALDWIAAGATASYGTASEPCAHPQKFPHPQVLLLSYLQGSTAIEAYWRSVAWPQQGVFVGEPLAAPFARR